MQIFLAETRVEFPPKLVTIISGYVLEVFKLSFEFESVIFNGE